jgi:hypothetical protein
VIEVGGQLHVLAVSPPGKALTIHIRQEAGWALELVWTLWSYQESNPGTSAVQPIAHLYTYWTIPTPIRLFCICTTWLHWEIFSHRMNLADPLITHSTHSLKCSTLFNRSHHVGFYSWPLFGRKEWQIYSDSARSL